ncbi:flagellar motor switch protein FliN [Ensifer aridi]|uniref:flagellar motor switch protein FliN n=1 Tax=Ensifer aridi TaxID=1708715 RepID=UPI00041A5A4D|nr:flagellar motor switch protein FliN [Ensifer aridi]
MAPKKAAPTAEPAAFTADVELDQAIDDLRGVLKKDGGTSDFGADFAAEPLASPADFGSDFRASGGAAFGGDFADTGNVGGFDAGTGFIGGDFDSAAAVSEPAPGSAMTANMDLIMDIPIDVQIVLGTSRMQVSGLMGLNEGATIALDRKIGEPVEIMVNGRVIGRGEITVLEGDVTRFGVKLIEIIGSKK